MNTKTKIGAFLAVVAIAFFVLLPINLHSQGKLGNSAFWVSLTIGLILSTWLVVVVPKAIAATYLPGNEGEAWRWAINFALLILLIAVGFGQFLPL